MNQEKLEQLVTETVLTYYERYHGEEGRRALSEVVLDCVGTDSADLAGAKQTAAYRLEEIGVAVSRLLDALNDGTRPFVEERLQTLDKEWLARQTQRTQDPSRHLLVGDQPDQFGSRNRQVRAAQIIGPRQYLRSGLRWPVPPNI